MKNKIKVKNRNKEFSETSYLNSTTYIDYLNRFKKISTSLFEWVNLPSSMSARYIEECLFNDGMCALLKDENYGFINTRCTTNGYINIYGLPTKLRCYSYGNMYQTDRILYTGLLNENDNDKCILVMNNNDRIPTLTTLELFARRLYEAERTCDVNIKAQKTPVMIVCGENQKLMMENLYLQYDGNEPFIFGDKEQLNGSMLQSIKTEAPFIADKVMEYKKQIWNEALTFLGINNLDLEKKERLIKDETSSNNELINLNLQSFLIPRKKACEEFNTYFGLTGTDKEISVRLRSDLFNIIKKEDSFIKDYNLDGIDDNFEVEDE